jgi:hypothetical protein
MFKALRRLWRRWLSWSMPTKISIVGTIASVVSVGLYFLDLRPFLERLASPPHVVRNISVRINNPDKNAVSLGYRDELVLWLPSAMADGAPRLGGAYEVVASDGGLVKDGAVPIRAAGQTRLVVKVMNQERLYQYLKRGDTTLTLMFHRPDGSLFFSENLPFTEDALKTFYTTADLAKKP